MTQGPPSTPPSTSRRTCMYALQMGLSGAYGHEFKPIRLDEVVHFDGVIVQDGVHGGSDGALYRRWLDGADSDTFVRESISLT
jgi:hypothetical protein